MNRPDLDPIQNLAIERAMAITREGGAIKIFGKAGTGKTTTGLALLENVLETGRKVICCAYTNKAVNRMVQVGYPKQMCRTVNRLLYATGIQIQVGDYTFSTEEADKILKADMKDEQQRDKVTEILAKVGVPEGASRLWIIDAIRKGKGDRVSGTVLRTEEQMMKESINRKTVILVDELSMLPLDAADELHGMFESVIYIGDPGQLPPVNSVDTCQFLGTDDQIELTTIHRVAGNEHLLDMIYALDAGKIPASAAPIGMDKFKDMARDRYQFICYTNDGVAWLNSEIRKTLELSGAPRKDEPLITVSRSRASRVVEITDENREWFLKNEARLCDQYSHSRGQIGATYKRAHGELVSATLYRMMPKNTVFTCWSDPVPADDDDRIYYVPVTDPDDPQDRVWVIKTVPFWKMSLTRKKGFRKLGASMSLDFAYAITAHKAQGSEWPKVAVMLRQAYRRDMGNPTAMDEIKRWNYTAATRGRQDIKIFTSIIGCPYG